MNRPSFVFNEVAPYKIWDPLYAAVGAMAGASAQGLSLKECALIGATAAIGFAVLQRVGPAPQ